MQQQLWTKAIALQQRILRRQYIKDKPRSRYAITLSSLRSDSELPNLLMRLELPYDADYVEDCMVKLFHRVWTSDLWQGADSEHAMQLLQSEKVPAKAKAVLISAVILSLFDFFDGRKLAFLLDAYLSDDDDVSQRALIGIILILRKDDELLPFYPEIESRLAILLDDDIFVGHAYNVMLQLQMSTEADRVSNRIRNDIMPAILKGSDMMKRRMGVIEINSRLTENGENPEWVRTDEADDSKAEQKMHEMVEMQLKGDDVFLITFSQLKSYRFFSETAHWLYPFSHDDPSLRDSQDFMTSERGSYVKMLLRTAPFCNSDKFSFCLLMQTMRQQGISSLLNQIEEQMASSEENLSPESVQYMKNRPLTAKEYSRNFIFDLYRFCYLYSFRSEFYNPFADAKHNIFSPLNIPALRALTRHSDLLMAHAEFLMRRGYYSDALDEFAFYMKDNEHTAELFQKMGFCHQKLGKWEQAQEYYERADSMKPDSKWTLLHLARVCILQDNYATALDCYRQVCEMEPDNVSYLLRQADCLMHTGQLADATDLLYKANYLDPESAGVRSMLGTALIIGKEYDKGIGYLDDPIECGIAHIAAHHPVEAVTLLRQALKLEGDATQFAEKFRKAAQPYCESGILTQRQAEPYLDACLSEKQF